jgi:ribbon-helix-helix CopG family protein
MADRVREPIQVYLTPKERAALDRVAREMGVSRSEALRRGIQAVGRGRLPEPLSDLGERGLITPATAGPGKPPPSDPVASLHELLSELAEDRADR